MLISKTMTNAINEQIGNEFGASMQYVAIASRNMLEWFLKEQLEEVSSMDNLLKVVQRAGERNLIHVEDYLGRRREKAGLVASGTRPKLPA